MNKTVARMVMILVLAALCAGTARAADPKGKLFIIGGGSRPQAMMQKFVDLALKGHQVTVYARHLLTLDRNHCNG